MLKRIEFYTVSIILAALIVLNFIASIRTPDPGTPVTNTEFLLQAERDSLLAAALSKDLKADSLQAVINRRDLDIKLIQKKYATPKKNVLVLGADSSLSVFLRSAAH